MRTWFAFGVAASIMLQSIVCEAADRAIQIVALSSQEEVFDQGVPWYTSAGPVTVSISVHAENSKRGVISLLLVNRGEVPTTVREEDVSIALSGTPIHVLSYAEMMKAEKRKEFWEKFANMEVNSKQ